MGREHLTIVHSSPSVLLVAVRSQIVEANVVAEVLVGDLE